jgi:penicillin-binding protein 1A
MKDRPQIPFRRPDNINLYTINAKTGVRASPDEEDSMIEAFKRGQEPLYAISQEDVIGADGNTLSLGEKDIPSLY